MRAPATNRSAQPEIHLHIERLVLEGLPVTGSETGLIQTAVEAELARLLGKNGIGPSSARFVARATSEDISLSKTTRPSSLGRRIGKSIHAAINASEPPPKTLNTKHISNSHK